MASLPGTFVLRNSWQRNAFRDSANGGNDPGDCGPGTVNCALDIASMAAYDTGIRPYGGARYSANERDDQNRKRAAQYVLIRKRAGASTFGATSQDGMYKAFVSFGKEFAAVNRQAPTAKLMYPDTWVNFKADIVAGRFGSLAIWRSPLVGAAHMGAESFAGKHAILVGNYDNSSGTEMVTLFDPLLDGRHNGDAKGPVVVPLTLIKSCTDLYTPGSNSSSVGSVYGWTFTPRALIASGQTITAISAANPTHVTTSAAHGLSTGDTIAVSGTNSTPALVGPYTVTVLDATHFTVPENVTVSGSAGTWRESDPASTEVPFDPCGSG